MVRIHVSRYVFTVLFTYSRLLSLDTQIARFLKCMLRQFNELHVYVFTDSMTATNTRSAIHDLIGRDRMSILTCATTLHCKDVLVDSCFLLTGSMNLSEHGVRENVETFGLYTRGDVLVSGMHRRAVVIDFLAQQLAAAQRRLDARRPPRQPRVDRAEQPRSTTVVTIAQFLRLYNQP